jgi:arylsulfatase
MTQPPPNILWICTDSQRWDTLGCYGNPHVKTPNVDKLAAEGMLMEHCYAQNPLCTPSRGGFLTGRYPVTTRLRQNGQCIPETEVLVTRLLADAGYTCGLVGKLHLSACDRRLTLGEDWWKRPERDRVVQGIERRIDDGYSEFHWCHAPSDKFYASAYMAWLHERDAKRCTPPRDDSVSVLKGMPSELHEVTWCAETTSEFIELQAESDTPWLFSVNIFDPHFSVDPPEDYLAPYLDRLDDIPLPNYTEGELANKPAWQQRRHDTKHYGYTGESDVGDSHEHRMCRAAYWAMCDHIDVQVGRILETLERTGQRENTIVIFTSDHGEMLGDHGVYIKGPFLYDPAIRVPLIVSWPGHIPAGVRSPALVELDDLAPTVLDAAGLPRAPGMQAQSLWPMLTGQTDCDHFRDDVYCEYLNSNPGPERINLTMLRTATHKIVAAHGHPTGELYDLRTDPGETRNLWHDPEHSEVKMELLERLCARMAWTADPLPPRIGIY